MVNLDRGNKINHQLWIINTTIFLLYLSYYFVNVYHMQINYVHIVSFRIF